MPMNERRGYVKQQRRRLAPSAVRQGGVGSETGIYVQIATIANSENLVGVQHRSDLCTRADYIVGSSAREARDGAD